MGGILGKLFKNIEANIVILGLDAAGKTTILQKLKCEINQSIITIGVTMETVAYKNLILQSFDMGGRSPMRMIFKHFIDKADAIIWVIDSNDKERFDEVKEEIKKMTDKCPHMTSVPLLIFANKQDLPNAMIIEDITKGIDTLSKWEAPHFTQASCATSGDGLYEGFDWLNAQIKNQIFTIKA